LFKEHIKTAPGWLSFILVVEACINQRAVVDFSFGRNEKSEARK